MTDDNERDRMAENELARRRRVNQLGAEVADLFVRMQAAMLEFKNDLQVAPLDALEIAAGCITDPEIRKVVDRLVVAYRDASREPTVGAFEFPAPLPLPIEQLITRLFAESAKENGSPDGQAPALACFVTLTNGGTLKGALSKTPEGIYRLMTPTSDPAASRGGDSHFVEHFFDLLEISVVTLERTVTKTAAAPRIWPV